MQQDLDGLSLQKSGSVIVIMGAAVLKSGTASGAMRRRIKGALDASKDCQECIFLTTGGIGRHGKAEAEVMKDLLVEAGVLEPRILIEVGSDDTFSSVVNCSEILKTHLNFERLIVCSDRYHVTRCVTLFRMLGLSAVGATIPSGLEANGWPRWFFYYLREVGAIVIDTMRMMRRRWLTRGSRFDLNIP